MSSTPSSEIDNPTQRKKWAFQVDHTPPPSHNHGMHFVQDTEDPKQPPTNPCAYCKRKGFHCEYVVVNPGRSSTSHNGHPGDATTSDVGSASSPEPTSWKPPSHRRASLRRLPALHYRFPGITGPFPHPTRPFRLCLPDARGPVIRRRRNPHIPLHRHNTPVVLIWRLPQISYMIFRLYTHLNIYPAPASQSAEHFNFAEDMQIPDLDLDFTATDIYAWALEVDAFHFGDDLAQSDGSETTPVPTSHESSTWRGSPSEG
ncbi:hypothetical protein B0H14DRAFT_3872836 [Mycena olivaceomarginata]|nr:hypothetical protein B0H14DRAFT_3872836 [Mycena olivaceomarginata]